MKCRSRYYEHVLNRLLAQYGVVHHFLAREVLESVAASSIPLSVADFEEWNRDVSEIDKYVVSKCIKQALLKLREEDWSCIRQCAMEWLLPQLDRQGRNQQEAARQTDILSLLFLAEQLEHTTPGSWWVRPLGQVRKVLEPEKKLALDANDWRLQGLYSGLAVGVRDMHNYMADTGNTVPAFLSEVIEKTKRDEGKWHPDPFPNYEQLQTNSFPKRITACAVARNVDWRMLGNVEMIDTRTIESGKRLFEFCLADIPTELKERLADNYAERNRIKSDSDQKVPLADFGAIWDFFANELSCVPTVAYLGFLINRTAYFE